MEHNGVAVESRKEIKFSIMTPVYKVEQFIDECIQSVLSQSYGNFELILVDDGSPDSSGEICDRYAQEDPRIRVFHKQNEGLLATRRYALALAQGDYYIFLDSDDYLETNALQVIADSISKYDADCIIYGLKRVLNGVEIGRTPEQPEQAVVIKDKRALYKKCLFNDKYNPLWRKSVKASLFRNADYSPYYHISLGEDLLQSLEFLPNSACTVFIPDALYNYRLNPESMTRTIRYENFKLDFTVRQFVLDFLRNENVFDELDYEEYRGCCIRLLIFRIEIIAGFSVSAQKKIELYERLIQDTYYTEFLSVGKYNKKYAGKKWFLFELLRHKQFNMILALCSLRKAMLRGK